MKTKKLTIIILIFGFFMVSFFECSDAGIAWDYKIVNCECEEDEIPLQGEISEETEIFKIEAKIPEIGNEKIDRELSDFVTKIISDFKQENPELPVINGQKPSWKNELWISPKIYEYSEDIKSVRFDVYQFTGGAHGMTSVFTKTYNLKTGEEITLDDLFQNKQNLLLTIGPIVRHNLKVKLGKMADDKWINKGTSETNLENYKNWVLEKGGLRIIFSYYQVGPRPAGMPEVLVPWEKINSILKPSFLILKQKNT
ncbi:hypothetical protein DRJ00_08445 [Candidatus Aerophobetes bacterium]|uniref:DUF3298/DUF4163 domain-containing protein n=1 Tax=Aerophobetes bacterium TaxID=2030807 RepID=A0A497E1S0_UNCAE|nr:MAG: hypothetical protein DRJ00_08445 [Candidatus Aerophobetes bacterium]